MSNSKNLNDASIYQPSLII